MITEEISRLKNLNSEILKSKKMPNFRNKNVFCVTRNGSKIQFIDPVQIDKKLDDLMCTVFGLCQQSEREENLLKSLALFWYGFVSIHPFEDGNMRTAKEYIKHKLEVAQINVRSLSPLKYIDLVGDYKTDLKSIEKALYECVRIH